MRRLGRALLATHDGDAGDEKADEGCAGERSRACKHEAFGDDAVVAARQKQGASESTDECSTEHEDEATKGYERPGNRGSRLGRGVGEVSSGATNAPYAEAEGE